MFSVGVLDGFSAAYQLQFSYVDLMPDNMPAAVASVGNRRGLRLMQTCV